MRNGIPIYDGYYFFEKVTFICARLADKSYTHRVVLLTTIPQNNIFQKICMFRIKLCKIIFTKFF